jgi:hypothetical protein
VRVSRIIGDCREPGHPRQALQADVLIAGPAKPPGVPALDAADLSLECGDREAAIGITPVGGRLQQSGELVGRISHPLGELGGDGAARHALGQQAPEFGVAIVRPPVPSITPAIPFVRFTVALIGATIPLVG